MILVLISLSLVLALFWMLQTKLREAVWQELKPVQMNTISLLVRSFVHQLMILSPRNVIAVASLDVSLGLKSLRESFLLICTHRISLVFLGLLFAFSLSSLTLLGLFLAAGFLLLLFLKKWKSSLQILMLAACFFVVYQFSFFTTSRWIFSQTENGLVYILSDGRWPYAFLFFLFGFVLSLVFKIESLVLVLTSILFFSGGLAMTNAMAMMSGELLASSLLWFFWSQNTDQIKKQYFKEIFLISLFAVVVFMSALFFLKGLGLLSVRILGGIEDKKIQFLLIWAILEVLLTVLLMGWGHFRFHFLDYDSKDVSIFSFKKSVWSKCGWIHNQIPARLFAARKKYDHLNQMLNSLTVNEMKLLPAGLLKKTRIEVESLKRLIDQLELHN